MANGSNGSNLDPPRKRWQLSLKRNKEDQEERFTFLSESEFGETFKPFQCRNTSYSTKWVGANIESWVRKRNVSKPEGERVPDDLLVNLCRW